MKCGAPLDTSVERVGLVQRKIVASAITKQHNNFLQSAMRFGFGVGYDRSFERNVMQVGEDSCRQFLSHRHNIDHTGLDGALRHTVCSCGNGILHQHQARSLLDRAQSQYAVRAHARQYDAHRVFLLVRRKGAQKSVYRQALATGFRWLAQMQRAMNDRQILVRRDQIDAIWLDPHVIFGLHHAHLRNPLNELR